VALIEFFFVPSGSEVPIASQPRTPVHRVEPVAASSPASLRSPLLRQRRLRCLEDELSDEDEDGGPTKTDPLVFKRASGDPRRDSAVASAPPPLCREGLVTLRRTEGESFGLDLEVTSPPLKVVVVGLKPGGAAERVRGGLTSGQMKDSRSSDGALPPPGGGGEPEPRRPAAPDRGHVGALLHVPPHL